MASIYYPDRTTAGQQLAEQLKAYQGQPNIVIALSDGGVIVGQPIAKQLQAHLTMLLLQPVKLPGEPDSLLSIREDGKYTYNNMWSTGQLEDFKTEYRTYIEQATQQQYSQLRQGLGVSCIASSDLLHDRNIILVSDGLKNGNSLDAAADFLKPVRYLKLVIAVPLVTIDVVDKMRLIGDDVHYLSTVNNYLETDHYYEKPDVPEHSKIVKMIEQELYPNTQ